MKQMPLSDSRTNKLRYGPEVKGDSAVILPTTCSDPPNTHTQVTAFQISVCMRECSGLSQRLIKTYTNAQNLVSFL